jgi:hypothetical protein
MKPNASVAIGTSKERIVVPSNRALGLVVGVYPQMWLTAGGPSMGRVLAHLALDRGPKFDLAPFNMGRL